MGGLKTLGPWAIAAAILYFLFNAIEFSDVWDATRSARLELFLPLMFVAVVLWFLLDSAAFAYLFTRFNAKLEWKEARSLRGMTYLLTPINWNLGTAAVILHLRSSKRIGAMESTSSMVFYQSIDGTVLATLAGVGAMLLPATPETVSIRNIAFGFALVSVVSLAFLMGSWPRFAWIEKFRGLSLFQSHRKASFKDVAVLMSLKALYFSVFIATYWLGCHAFGIDIPLQFALASTPAVLMSGALPITPAGLGTQQAAMLYFYAPYGDDASVLAFGLVFPAVLLLFRLLLGVPYLSDLPKLRAAMAEQRATAHLGDAQRP